CFGNGRTRRNRGGRKDRKETFFSAISACSAVKRASELHFESELCLTRHVRRAGVLVRRAEQRGRRRSGRAQRRVVAAEVPMVEEVEHFRHELHLGGAAKLDVFGEVQVHFVERQP